MASRSLKKRSFGTAHGSPATSPSSRLRLHDQQLQQQQQQQRQAPDTINPLASLLFSTATATATATGNASNSHAAIELQALEAELEHERSLRVLDNRRAEQTQGRLERHLALATEEAQEAKSLVEEIRSQSDAHIEQVREARNDALMQLRECQITLEQAEEEAEFVQEARLAQEKQRMLQSHLQAKEQETEALKKRLEETEGHLAEAVLLQRECNKERDDDDDDDNDDNEGTLNQTELPNALSPAPKAVLKELNRVRIQQAESDRKFRQLKRKSSEWQQRSTEYVQQREAARSATARVHQLEIQINDLNRETEAAAALHNNWSAFGKRLCEVLALQEKTSATQREPSTSMLTCTTTKGTPPEISAMVRYLDKARDHTKQLEQEKNSLHRQLESTRNRVTALEQNVKDETSVQAKANVELKETQSRFEKTNQNLLTMQAQEGIWKREADSLRSLLETYDQMGQPMLQQNAARGKQQQNEDQQINAAERSTHQQPVIKGLEVSLQATRDELQLLTEARDHLSKEVESCQSEHRDLQVEHSRVVEKFKRLRNALVVERTKAEEADARACKAEALAGKGSFNPEETRVLHLQNNPLTDAIRQRYQTQIDALRKQVEEAENVEKAGCNITSSSTNSVLHSEVDPQKLHKRLKESFKEQIGIFREGVYLMTGYKVDMLPNTDRPTFRVRSVYAEQEQDHLVFVWPKSTEEAQSLDLVETEQAKLLSTTDSYQYMTKFNSLPAFLASVQLSLFEKQTFVG